MNTYTEREAWLAIATLIVGAPDGLVVADGTTMAGLCCAISLMHLDGLVSLTTRDRMDARIGAALESLRGSRQDRPAWLAPTRSWGPVRLSYCLRFAEECR